MWMDARIPVAIRADLPAPDPRTLLLIAGADSGPAAPDVHEMRAGWAGIWPLPALPSPDGTGVAAATHPAGCACCLERSLLARALSALFVARARGEVGLFRTVLLVGPEAVWKPLLEAALSDDPMVSGRYRAALADVPDGPSQAVEFAKF